MTGLVRLRPFGPGEVAPDASSEWDDWGPFEPDPNFVVCRLIVMAEGFAAGEVSWHPVAYGPNHGSKAYNIGISLLPEFRGRGIGSSAQRLLVEHLFATTAVHRVEASTDVANIAEQHALKRAGFTREGILFGAQYRSGDWHDLVSYSCVRVAGPARRARTR